MAEVYHLIGRTEKAEKLEVDAGVLKSQFEESFWMEDQQFYALPLAKEKKQVGTVTSNPGHVLLSGMLDSDKTTAVSNMLVSNKMYSGYGIRTMGEGEAGYNPISYHNGSVWPHDNSVIILGMSKTNNQKQAAK